jgi:transcriptional regulator with XRE-family HTH domain
MTKKKGSRTLGKRLREVRQSRGLSLREAATRAGVNHGYLSQLEHGEVAEPSPSMLHKVAAGYEVPFPVLMEWAGYIQRDQSNLTPKQALALSYLGDDISDKDLDAIRAVLDAIRSHRATFASDVNSLDAFLGAPIRADIRSQAEKLLRRADALGIVPTPLDQVMDVAKLVAAGEINLNESERRKLRKIFGALADAVLDKLRGVIHLGAREVWVKPNLHELKKRFVMAHEIGHDLLPWQKETFVYLDDENSLRPDVRVRFEREANQAAIELLAQGDALRKEADDSRLTLGLISRISSKYGISLQATARRVVEETRKTAAVAIRFRGRGGRLGPFHVYCSSTFEKRFGWHLGALPSEARYGAREAAQSAEGVTSFLLPDLSSRFTEVRVEAVDTAHAVIALYMPAAKASNLRRWLEVG